MKLDEYSWPQGRVVVNRESGNIVILEDGVEIARFHLEDERIKAKGWAAGRMLAHIVGIVETIG